MKYIPSLGELRKNTPRDGISISSNFPRSGSKSDKYVYIVQWCMDMLRRFGCTCYTHANEPLPVWGVLVS